MENKSKGIQILDIISNSFLNLCSVWTISRNVSNYLKVGQNPASVLDTPSSGIMQKCAFQRSRLLSTIWAQNAF